MPIPLIGAASSSIGPSLAKHGLDLLGGIFRGSMKKGAQEVAGLIHEKTGIDINDAADDKLTPEQWLQLKQFEFDHQEKLLQARQQSAAADLEAEKVHQADRANARAMQQKALESEDWLPRNFVYIYALIMTFMTFLYIFWSSFFVKGLADGQQRTIDTVLGFLLGVSLSAIVQYFFGSSSGSKAKEKKLQALYDDALTGEPGSRPGEAAP